jgi:membrane protein required for colicin V production
LNYIDLIIILLIAWAAYRGFTRGLVVMVAVIIALILGIWGAAKFSNVVANWLTAYMNLSSPYLHLISFTVTFIGIVIGINLVAFLLSKLLDFIALGFINRLLGAAFGIVKMALILSVIFVILNAFNTRHEFLPDEQVENSLFYKPVARLAPGIFPILRFDLITRELEKIIEGTAVSQ